MDTYQFILYALFYLISAMIMVPIFKKLGLGSVLGYLAAGILIGPWGLVLIYDVESIMHFSELGVVFLLFIIGLELQPSKIWSLRNRLIGLGGSQILITSLLIALIGYINNFNITTSLVVGFILSLSSTAFALQILTERNQLNTEAGRSSFAVLLMQDLAAIPALAIIPLLGVQVAKEEGSGLTKIITIILILVSLFLIGRFLMRPIFRLIASTRSRELFTATTLFIVLGVSYLMHMVELSMALGSFLAGVLLSESEYKHELEADLDPFKGLLMGLFFISVGMAMNIGVIWNKPIAVLLYTVIYMVIKLFTIYYIGRWMGLKSTVSRTMAVTLSQGGEFAFVLLGLTQQIQLLNQEVTDLLIVVVSVSMALTPIFLMLDERFIQKFMNRKNQIPNYDQPEHEEGHVIIAGFGRVGQIFGRVLRTQGIPFTALDHDSEQVDVVRRFGNRVFYGDASRSDLLEAAGAERARALIIAIDDVESSVKIANIVKKTYPKLPIYARARNRMHVFGLLEAGVTKIKRETFDSSLNHTRELLVDLGFSEEASISIIEKFKKHDEETLIKQYRVHHNQKEMINVSKQASEQLIELFKSDRITSKQ